MTVKHVRQIAALVRAPPITVLPATINSSPCLVNVSPPAQLDITGLILLAFNVTATVPAAPDPLLINAQHAPRIVLFSILGVAYEHAATQPSTMTSPLLYACLATRLAQAALVLVMINVWDVRLMQL